MESAEEVLEKFDFLAYQKGAAIIRMFHEALTPKTFTKGLKYYLTTMSFSAATPDDLHRGLQKAFDEDFPDNGIDIGAVMSTWEDQPGYPVVHVEKSGSKFKLTQKKFDDRNGTFDIPISFARKSDTNLNDSSVKLWMTTKTIEIEAGTDDWILVNVGSTGYFKVTYTEKISDAFIETFLNGKTAVPVSNRAEILESIVFVLEDEPLPLQRVFKIFDYIKFETDYRVWNVLVPLATNFLKRLSRTKVEKKFQKFVHLLIQPFLDKIGFKPVDGEPIKNTNFRKFLLHLSCESKQKDCLQFEMEKLMKSIEANETVDIFCHGAKILDEKTYMKLLTKLKQDKQLGENSGLECSLNKKLLETFLNTTFSCLESEDFLYQLFQTMKTSVEGLDVGLAFMMENFERIAKM